MAEKHIFIGLGGSGVRTVSKLKYKIYENITETRSESRLKQLNATYRFIFVDTDNNDVNTANRFYEKQFENGQIKLINPNSELLDLGPENPFTIFEHFQKKPDFQISKRMIEAYDGNVSARIFNHNLRDGAGAFRAASRIAFAQSIETFSSKLKACINDLNSIEKGAERNEIYYWIVSGSCGGTGCGIVNDALYYVNMLHKQKVANEDPYVALVLYMPQCYIEAKFKNMRFPRNGYATLSELKAFQCAARKEQYQKLFHRMAILPDYHQIDTNLAYRPFKYCIPVDLQTDNGTNMNDIPTMYSNTAEMLYYVHGGSGALSTRSDLSNSIDEACVNDPNAFLLPMGYIALRKPEKYLEDYLDARMRYELVKYGILGQGIKDRESRKKIAEGLFNDIVVKNVLDGGNSKNSLSDRFKAFVNRDIEEYFDEAKIKEEGKDIISNKLPEGFDNNAVEDLIKDCRRKIEKESLTEQEQVLDKTEADLWQWTEKMIMKHGIQYVLDVLYELDGCCQTYYYDYIKKHSASFLGVRKQDVDNIRVTLDDLYQKAADITFFERFGKNREDVSAYINALRDYAEKQLYQLISEEIYKVVKKLHVDEDGRIDKIEHYVAALKEKVFHLLSKKDGIEDAYKKSLSKAFADKRLDVTSVYLPAIDEFADGYGWKDGHLFSKLYGAIIKPGEEYEDGNGYAPVRNDDDLSLEQFFVHIKKENEDVLKKKGYVIENTICLFLNPSLDNSEKLLEDLLGAASVTMRNLSKKNERITEYCNKTIAQLFDGLDKSRKEAIQERMNPSLFFSYTKSMSNQPLSEYKIYVAPSEDVARNVLNYTNDGNSFFQGSTDTKSLYVLRSKVGMTLEYYRTYDVIKREYDREEHKAEYHFHKAFAYANGELSRIQLKKEYEPQLITFAQYLLIDSYKDLLKDYYYVSEDVFDRDHYTNTPFIQEDGRVLIATMENVSIRNGIVCLTSKDGSGSDTFLSIVYSGYSSVYRTIYNKFHTHYSNDNLEKTIELIIREMNKIAASVFQVSYSKVYRELVDKLNTVWHEEKNREEKIFIAELLSVLKSELDTFDKFIL